MDYTHIKKVSKCKDNDKIFGKRYGRQVVLGSIFETRGIWDEERDRTRRYRPAELQR